jgi:hypothetical protein
MTPMCHSAVRVSVNSHIHGPCLLPSTLCILYILRYSPVNPSVTADTNQEDARRIVSWSKYPPRGTRGYGPMFSGHSFDTAEGDYASQADDNLLVIVQIESQKGVDDVEEIAKVEGLDVLFIGEYKVQNGE